MIFLIIKFKLYPVKIVLFRIIKRKEDDTTIK